MTPGLESLPRAGAQRRLPAPVVLSIVDLVLAGRGEGRVPRPRQRDLRIRAQDPQPVLRDAAAERHCAQGIRAGGRRPAFTRFNVFLRDRFHCQYCGGDFATNELTFDHVVPKSRGGRTAWTNVVTACSPCNLLKGNQLLRESGLAAAALSVRADDAGTAGERPRLPARLPARKLARLPVLGQRAGSDLIGRALRRARLQSARVRAPKTQMRVDSQIASREPALMAPVSAS